MKVAGMVRLAEIDQKKLGKDLMKLSISKLADMVSHLYFLEIGNVDSDVIDFINSLGKEIKITKAINDYMSGWMFKNNESLDDLYKTIDGDFDWILYPDADDILPEHTLELLEEADSIGAEKVRFYFIECFGSANDVIEVKSGYPIGPHFKAVKLKNDITFVGSHGFNEPIANREMKKLETEYCMRHLRYANIAGIEERKRMNYFQEYFLQNHNTIAYSPKQTFKYYMR